MKNVLVLFLGLFVGGQIVYSQDLPAFKSDIRGQREAILKERQRQTQSTAQVSSAAVSADDVGEPDSFGKNAQFLGIAQSGIVIIDDTCDPNEIGPLGPDDHCIQKSDPALDQGTGITINNIARITIPGKSTSNIVYAIANHTVSAALLNQGPNPELARFFYTPSVTLESEVLNDPTLIDPTTNLPYNGSFTTTGLGNITRAYTLAAGAFDNETRSYSRANTLGFSRTFFSQLGLPSSVIDKLYKKPMTIKLNVRLRARLVESALIVYTIRFLGN
jgi:hypothetical protein